VPLADPATAQVAQGQRVPESEGDNDEAGHGTTLTWPCDSVAAWDKSSDEQKIDLSSNLEPCPYV
jgi:hypothetical protein